MVLLILHCISIVLKIVAKVTSTDFASMKGSFDFIAISKEAHAIHKRLWSNIQSKGAYRHFPFWKIMPQNIPFHSIE